MYQPVGYNNQLQNSNVAFTGKIEKDFLTSNMIQNFRHCNTLSWNNVNSNIFAAGYESSKNDSSLFIWDINKKQDPNSNKLTFSKEHEYIPTSQTVGVLERKQGKEVISDPLSMFTKVHDDIYSLSWFPESQSELIFGSDKQVKIFDTRSQYNKAVFEDTHSKQVIGIKFDPSDHKKFASFSVDCIKIFDLRNTKKAQFDIRYREDFGGFDWSLYRPNLIVSFLKQSNEILFWDLNQSDSNSSFQSSNYSNFYTQHKEQPQKILKSSDYVAGVTWIPPKVTSDKNRFFVHNYKGYIEEKEFIERDSYSMAMSARGCICMSTADRKILQSVPFFEQAINYKYMTSSRYMMDRESLNSNYLKYSEEGPFFVDMQNVIVNRIKGGYNLDSISRNAHLSQLFRGSSECYGQINAYQLQQFRGIKTFWSWLKRIQESEHVDFIDGINKYLDIDVLEEKSPSFRQKGIDNQDIIEKILNFKVFNSTKRQAILKFCGWTDYLRTSAQLQNRGPNRGGMSNLTQNPQTTKLEIESICRSIEEQENQFEGGQARPCIIATLHFDFHQALGLASLSASMQKYKEEANNMQILLRTLGFLNELRSLQGGQVNDQILQEKLASLMNFIRNISNQMKNPYFKAFFQFLERNNLWFQDSKINFLDQLAIMSRFLSMQDIENYIKKIIHSKDSAITEGNLDIIPFIGLNSPLLVQVLQNYVDKFGDIQTAAYISVYAIEIQKLNKIEDHIVYLKRFIREYRELLNNLQLWNQRAEFDVAKGQIEKSPLMKKYAQYLMQNQHQVMTQRPLKMDSFNFGNAQDALGRNLSSDMIKYSKYGYSIDPYDKTPYENSAKCYFCNNCFSVKTYMQNLESSVTATHSKKENTNVLVIQCSNCTNSVNNCAICLQPIGLLNPYIQLLKNRKQQPSSKFKMMGQQNQMNEGPQEGQDDISMKRQLQYWMLWCQTCRHGGHAAHINDWFKNHSECPISECNCNCIFQD